jgi:hypothetical protein
MPKLGEVLRRCRDDLELDVMITKERWNALVGLRFGMDMHLKNSSWNELIELGVFLPTNGRRVSCHINFDQMYDIMQSNCGPVAPHRTRTEKRTKQLEEDLDEIRTEKRLDELINAKVVN